MIERLAAATAALLIVSAGAVHGLWDGRWGTPSGLKEPVARLARVPKVVGDWVDQGDRKLDDREMAVAEIAGYVARNYRNRRTGQALSIMLVCGRPGPISVHTPDVCYSGAGYEVSKGPDAAEVAYGPGKRVATFQEATFRKQASLTPADLDIRWAWGASGSWETPAEPRLAYARNPALYKLYIVRDAGATGETDPSAAFLSEFLPMLDDALFGAVNPTK